MVFHPERVYSRIHDDCYVPTVGSLTGLNGNPTIGDPTLDSRTHVFH